MVIGGRGDVHGVSGSLIQMTMACNFVLNAHECIDSLDSKSEGYLYAYRGRQ